MEPGLVMGSERTGDMMHAYRIVDAHVHTYQSREIGLQAKQGNDRTSYAGVPEELMSVMKRTGIGRAVMVNMLPLAEMRKAAVEKLPSDQPGGGHDAALAEIDQLMLRRLERRNTWTCQLAVKHPELVPFINLDPLQDEAAVRDELADKVDTQGARGIKLHPGSQWFYPNDRRLWPIYEAACERSLPIVFHSGRFVSPQQYARPKHFAELLDAFPGLIVVMAHLGQGWTDEALELAAIHTDVMFDCSAIISQVEPTGEMPPERLTAIIRRAGVERVMFGSDFPWFDPAEAVEKALLLGLNQAEKRLLLAENAIRIFRL